MREGIQDVREALDSQRAVLNDLAKVAIRAMNGQPPTEASVIEAQDLRGFSQKLVADLRTAVRASPGEPALLALLLEAEGLLVRVELITTKIENAGP